MGFVGSVRVDGTCTPDSGESSGSRAALLSSNTTHSCGCARPTQASDTMRTMIVTDTSPAARAVLTGLYQKAGPVKCLRIALQMSEDYRAVAASGIRSRRPQATEAEVRRELATLYLGRELADRVLGPEPR